MSRGKMDTALASIGLTGGITGRSMPPWLHAGPAASAERPAGGICRRRGHGNRVGLSIPRDHVADPRGQARAPVLAAWAAWAPSANSSTILAQKAGRSAGLRLETMPTSVTHSSSTQFAPALRRSVFRLGQEVIVLPLTTSASISVHGA